MKKHFGFSLFAVAASFMLLGAGCNYYSAPTGKSLPAETIPAPAESLPKAQTTPQAQAPSAQMAVKIENYAFQPDNLTVKAGTTVTWTNNDNVPHKVVALDGSFGSGTMYKGSTFSYTFTKPGAVSYICSIHTSMRGNVIVTE